MFKDHLIQDIFYDITHRGYRICWFTCACPSFLAGKKFVHWNEELRYLYKFQPLHKYYLSAGYNLPEFNDYYNSFEWGDCDLDDFEGLTECCDDVDEIIHAAAVVSYNLEKKWIKKINIDSTTFLVNIAIEKKIQRFHYVSSIASLERNENGFISEMLKNKPVESSSDIQDQSTSLKLKSGAI